MLQAFEAIVKEMAVLVDKLPHHNSHSGSNVKLHDSIDGHTEKSTCSRC